QPSKIYQLATMRNCSPPHAPRARHCLMPSLDRRISVVCGVGSQELALFHRYKWVAAVVGVLLTGAPLLWLTSWLQKQGEAEVPISAHWSVGIPELMIGQTGTRVTDLATKKVDSCQPSHIAALRQAVFASGLIRELAIVDAGGQTLCTDTGT